MADTDNTPIECSHPRGERAVTTFTGGGFLNVPAGRRVVCTGCGWDFGPYIPNLGQIATELQYAEAFGYTDRGVALAAQSVLDKHCITAAEFDAEVLRRTDERTRYFLLPNARQLVEWLTERAA